MMKTMMKILLPAAMLLPCALNAQQTLTLQECRDLALQNNNDLKIAEQKVEIAGYDRKIAMANYFPNITASAAYMYNSKKIDLLSEDVTSALTTSGDKAQAALGGKLSEIMSNPLLSQLIKHNPDLQKLFNDLASMDIATPINAIGTEIDKAFTIDIQNMFLGAVSLQQPVFMGGKIVAANKMAGLAEDLARSQYDMQTRSVVIEVDNAYWQIIAIANKKKLAESYAELLHQMEHDTDIMIAEGVATKSDALTVKVKANEADMMLTKATNGLVLSKMLLCKLCGLGLDSEILLADETLDAIPRPMMCAEKTQEEIFSARPEIRSLDIATKIYDKKVAIARADMMPKIALTGNYLLTNPNLYHGPQNTFSGMFNVGVAINIPIIHGCEAMQKMRKAKAEAVLTRYRLEDAKEMVTLQVTQLRRQQEEAYERLDMAENNLSSAEENLRTATIGFNEGVIPANTVLSAQTAWLQAHSEYIAAGVDLQMCSTNLKNATGDDL